MDTTSNLEVADIVGNLIAQIIYDAIYNSHSDIDDIKKSVNALLQINQEVLERLYNEELTTYTPTKEDKKNSLFYNFSFEKLKYM